jgi:DNA mismatch endonuclease (patch repair protein)
MSRIKPYGTEPELRMLALLERWLPDVEIVQQPKGLVGKPDFLVPSLKLIIFVDGCFFHKCPEHYVEPVQNADYWIPKIEKNVRRDRSNRRELRRSGYRIIRIWEHDLKGKKIKGRDRIRRRIRHAQKTHSSLIQD